MVVTLNDPAYLETLDHTVSSSRLIHWIANIRLIRLFLSVPYFRYSDEGKTIRIHHHDGEWPEIPDFILTTGIDITKDPLLRIDAFRSMSGEVRVVFSFHHVLFDGRGCGLLLQHLTTNTDEENLEGVFPVKIRRKPLMRQIINMFQVKKMVEYSSRSPIGHLPVVDENNHEFTLRTVSFSKEETLKIDHLARENGSRFGTNLFQIACVAHALMPLIQPNAPLWVPIPYDGRKRGSTGPVVSNNMSFLFYRIDVTEETTLKATVLGMQQQMNEQLKSGLPNKYDDLLQFMRYIPKRFNYWMMTKSSKGKVSSFLYSSSGESYYDVGKFSDAFKDTLIIPPYSYPPGIIVNFLRDNGQLKLNIGGFSRILSSNQLSLLEDRLKRLLLNH